MCHLMAPAPYVAGEDSYESLRRAVALEYGVSESDIDGPRRVAHIVRARHDLWRRLRARGWSLLAIGEAAGRDHTTVLEALRKCR